MSFQRVRKSIRLHMPHGKAHGTAVLAALVAVLLAPVVSRGLLRRSDPGIDPAIIALADTAAPNDSDSQKAKKNASAEQVAASQKQIAEDSALLLKMAADLKAEVDKTSKDTLSVSVIRKAAAVEKLAHDVKEKMKISMGMN